MVNEGFRAIYKANPIEEVGFSSCVHKLKT